MTYTVWNFAISDLVNKGRLAGIAGICLDARYCSVAWVGSDRLDRGHPGTWKALQEQIGHGFSPEPLPRHSAIYGVLTGDGAGAVSVRYLSRQPVTIEHPHQVAQALDQLVRSQVDAYIHTK